MANNFGSLPFLLFSESLPEDEVVAEFRSFTSLARFSYAVNASSKRLKSSSGVHEVEERSKAGRSALKDGNVEPGDEGSEISDSMSTGNVWCGERRVKGVDRGVL